MANFNPANHSAFLNAVSTLPERKKNDGSGRAAAAVADQFNISVSAVYQARAVLKRGSPELINALRDGDIPVKTAYKILLNKKSLPLIGERRYGREKIMTLNGFEDISYLKDSASILKEIKNVEKTLNDSGYASAVTPRFYLEKNNMSFDIRVSFAMPQSRAEE
ncbi:hypothetical protein R84B8_01817 [Treponema sp. R8-4-B8]